MQHPVLIRSLQKYYTFIDKYLIYVQIPTEVRYLVWLKNTQGYLDLVITFNIFYLFILYFYYIISMRSLTLGRSY